MAQNGKGFGKICVAKKRIPPSRAPRRARRDVISEIIIFLPCRNAHMQSACMVTNHGIAGGSFAEPEQLSRYSSSTAIPTINLEFSS